MEWDLLALTGFLIWLVVLLLPWKPWDTDESLDANDPDTRADLSPITVLIPARNEQDVISDTLDGLTQQGKNLNIILIDDQSNDQTSEIARSKNLPYLQIIHGRSLASGWSGKLWALEQGRLMAKTPLILLLDADIYLKPHILNTLLLKMEREQLDLISLMARLRMESFWEKLLIPAFIFFFKLLYPFSLSNSVQSRVAAAAGGCILVKTDMLEKVNAFNSLKQCLIDDCSLARKIKNAGGRIWLGLTHSAVSLRPYNKLDNIWAMVDRSAFTQLQHSWLLLLLTTLLMIAAFVNPVLAIIYGDSVAVILGLCTLVFLFICYLPVLNFYSINPLWGCFLPVIGTLFLCMTWSSAWQYLTDKGARWKDRSYSMNAQK
jgi:hopene-associated glycosyltransferase HpnB